MSQQNNPTSNSTNCEPNILTVYRKDLVKFCEHVPIEGVVYSMFRQMQKQFHSYEKAIFQEIDGNCKVLFDRYN